MRKVLVLAVDRDNDFGDKGRVLTPAVGIARCKEAAAALGIADPEDSDTNALYAAIKVCLEIRDDGGDAEVALICGDSNVGHRSDERLVKELETILERINPDGIVLVGDGAEDEYIYPIIASRARVDSVRKVYIRQVPGIEGSFYIISRMMADPGKRKRFIAPIGLLMMLISLFFIIPNLLLYLGDGKTSSLLGMSGSLCVFSIGLVLLLYGYNIVNKASEFKSYVYDNVFKQSTNLVFLILSAFTLLMSAIWAYLDTGSLYFPNFTARAAFFLQSMAWPIGIALMLYFTGKIVTDYQEAKRFNMLNIMYCVTLAACCFLITGLFDIALTYISFQDTLAVGMIETVLGVIFWIVTSGIINRIDKSRRREKRKIRKKGSAARRSGRDSDAFL